MKKELKPALKGSIWRRGYSRAYIHRDKSSNTSSAILAWPTSATSSYRPEMIPHSPSPFYLSHLSSTWCPNQRSLRRPSGPESATPPPRNPLPDFPSSSPTRSPPPPDQNRRQASLPGPSSRPPPHQPAHPDHRPHPHQSTPQTACASLPLEREAAGGSDPSLLRRHQPDPCRNLRSDLLRLASCGSSRALCGSCRRGLRCGLGGGGA